MKEQGHHRQQGREGLAEEPLEVMLVSAADRGWREGGREGGRSEGGRREGGGREGGGREGGRRGRERDSGSLETH